MAKYLSALIVALAIPIQCLDASPVVSRFEFEKSNMPFRSNAGLGGNSGNYDLVGGFTLSLDEESGTAFLSNFDVVLQGTPQDFDLNGLEFAPRMLGQFDSIEGTILSDGSIQFERCTSGHNNSTIDCFSFFDDGPEVALYPFALRTRLTLSFLDGGNRLSLSGSRSHIGLVADGSSSYLDGANAALVPAPEPTTFTLALLALLGFAGRLRKRST